MYLNFFYQNPRECLSLSGAIRKNSLTQVSMEVYSVPLSAAYSVSVALLE